jgi:hypothetical protein
VNLEAKSRLGGSGAESARRAANLKSVPLRPAPERRQLQDPDAPVVSAEREAVVVGEQKQLGPGGPGAKG